MGFAFPKAQAVNVWVVQVRVSPIFGHRHPRHDGHHGKTIHGHHVIIEKLSFANGAADGFSRIQKKGERGIYQTHVKTLQFSKIQQLLVDFSGHPLSFRALSTLGHPDVGL